MQNHEPPTAEGWRCANRDLEQFPPLFALILAILPVSCHRFVRVAENPV
jgi:hypothetical protein